jgi:DNA-binding response OmpR family regulator
MSRPESLQGSDMPKILVVDDDLSILATIGMGLRKAGYQVIQVDTPQLVLSVCKNEKPDLAILDMVMPGVDGLELGRLLKSETTTPFIFLSGHGEEDLIKSAVSVGALGYLIKPIRISHIVPMIEEALKRTDESPEVQSGNASLDDTNIDSTIDQAINCLMQRDRLSRAEAYDLLREHARQHPDGIEALAKLLISDPEVRLVQSSSL